MIFFHSDEQKEVAEKVKSELQTLLDEEAPHKFEEPIVQTGIALATIYFPAEEYH